VVGDSTATTDGVDLSAQYIVNHAAAPVVSTSYGSCEQEMGTAELAFYNSLWEQAASQGMSAFVAAGDAGAAGCNTGSDTSGSGTAVNGLCSSPYSTCVGGTEFNEGPNDAKYWATTNSASEGSALSYIPEEVWNESGLDGGSGLWASGGGASIVYPEPAWQKGVSGTSGGMRAVPDVAMSAAGHDGYVIYENGSYWIISGTSAASPSFAGVMALVVESQGGTGQGNANAGLYPLLNATHNPFHATPSGNNSVPGVTGFTASGGEYNLATGLGSVDGAVLVSSWGAGAGGVTGMQPPTLTLTAASSSVVVAQGASGTVNLRVVTGGSFSGPISLQVGGLPMGVTARWSANPVTPAASASANQVTLTFRVSGMARVGPATITVTARGDGVTAAGQIALQVQTGQGCGWRLRLLPSRCGLPVRAPIK
jgi:subtilase family serine protease